MNRIMDKKTNKNNLPLNIEISDDDMAIIGGDSVHRLG